MRISTVGLSYMCVAATFVCCVYSDGENGDDVDCDEQKVVAAHISFFAFAFAARADLTSGSVSIYTGTFGEGHRIVTVDDSLARDLMYIFKEMRDAAPSYLVPRAIRSYDGLPSVTILGDTMFFNDIGYEREFETFALHYIVMALEKVEKSGHHVEWSILPDK